MSCGFDSENLKGQYLVVCPTCAVELGVSPSTAMLSGVNWGFSFCTNCRGVLSLRIDGDRMIAVDIDGGNDE